MVIGSWIIFIIFLILASAIKQPVLTTIAVISGIFSLFNLAFFRDPERTIPKEPNVILSPADGKVIQISEVPEHDFFDTRVTRISIFLSVFNVHVNRSPISGKVEHFRYQRGSFFPAFNEAASVENEQTIIGIIDEQGRKIMFTQIAGIIARRIVCELREGQTTEAGERMGMIRFGSRVDVYFISDEVTLRIKKGDRVKGGESIIGEFN